MRILHVIASIAPRYGGPSVACPALCQELARRGHEVSIYTTNVDGNGHQPIPLAKPLTDKGVEVRYYPGWTIPREYKPSLSLWRALRKKILTVDVVHIYSMYIFSATAAAHFCRKYYVPYLLHPHGTLDPYLLRRHALRKGIYTILLERKRFRHAAAILFNSAEEMRLAAPWLTRHMSTASGNTRPINAVVPVGVESDWFVPLDPAVRQQIYSRFPSLNGKRLIVFFGRINFKKGLDILARAFAAVARQQPDTHLVIAGPDDGGHSKRVRQWLAEGGVLPQATFTGPLWDKHRCALMQMADVFILPSYSENFGQSVAEAMASGIPVVISDQVNLWPEVRTANAGIIVRCDVEETAQAALTILRNAHVAREMGHRGRRLVHERYTWNAVGAQMEQLYEEICRSGNKDSLRVETCK